MRDDRSFLQDIREAIVIIRRCTPARREDLDADLPVQSLLIRYSQIIGEAAWQLSDAMKAAHPHIPWQRIAAMRHVLVHDYFRVDLDQVWAVATHHVLVLQPQIQGVLAPLPPDTAP